jgi:hypothetical protein
VVQGRQRKKCVPSPQKEELILLTHYGLFYLIPFGSSSNLGAIAAAQAF